MSFHYRAPTPSDAQARVGTSIRGKYVIESLLGTGGMASVYRARHRTGHRVALKIVHPDLARKLGEGARSWILREGILTNAVEHSCVPRVLDDDTDENGTPMLVMDFHDGEALSEHAMRLGHRLPAGRVLDLAEHMLDVLSAVHACGIVHCDIKPDNFLLARDSSKLMLLDFGIARSKAVDLPALPPEIAHAPLGTPEYMPPEQSSGRWDWVDARSDLYALAASLHVLLVGRFVRDGTSLRRSGVRTVLTDAIDIGLSFDPDARYRTADAMHAALRTARNRFTRVPSGTWTREDLKTPTSTGRIARAS